MNRIVEVYTGAYASGKSEISINRALMLNENKPKVTLVDLDTVEPAYTLRPIKKKVEELGINVVTQESYFGLGEAGSTITGLQKNCLNLIEDDIVIDVGYGVGGLDILEVVNDIEKEENLKIYIVINTSKFETSSVENIVEYVQWSEGTNPHEWKKFSGIICNPHFSDDTTKDDIINGYEITKEAAKELNLPIKALCISEKNYDEFNTDVYDGTPIWKLKRFMPEALW